MIYTANNIDITSLVGTSGTLDSSLDALGDQLNFEIANATPAYIRRAAVSVETGALIQLFDDFKKEVFRGIVVSKTNNVLTRSFACFDYAFYLNKSKVIKQFNKVRADVAIMQLLSEFKVPVGTIAPMSVIIDKIYYDKEVSAVIDDIMDTVTKTTGVKYIREMNSGKFYIFRDTDLIISCQVRLAENLPLIDVGKTISNPTKTASIEEMKNCIKLYVGDDSGLKVYAEVKSDTLIAKYGLLQETQSIDKGDIARANLIAKNMLNDLGKVIVEGSIDVLGHFDLRAGRILVLNEPITNMVGKYKIKAASHSLGDRHTARLDLKEVV
jgi:hypothetical protein